MGHFGFTSRPANMKTLGLLFLTCVSCSPVEIINYNDVEAGHGQKMEGVPGMEVEGSFYWKAPEGDDIKLVYTAGEEGYVATGDHLPVSPDVPEAPMMVLPVMPNLTPEVAEARSSFMQIFDEIKMKNDEEAVEVVDDAVIMEKREADADPLLVQYQQTLPLYRTYAPAYPHYFNFVYPPSPTQPKVFIQSEDDQKKEEIMEDSSQKLPPQPFITPSYYPVYQPLYQPLLQQKQVLSSFRYPLTYPGLTYYPGLLTSPSSTFTGVSQPAPAMDSMEPSGGVLPSETLEGEEESAALLL